MRDGIGPSFFAAVSGERPMRAAILHQAREITPKLVKFPMTVFMIWHPMTLASLRWEGVKSMKVQKVTHVFLNYKVAKNA
jgi:hypothetical protein